MTEARLYYTPPSDEAFEDLKLAAISIWNTYDHEDYRNEKIGAIKDIRNISDNFMYMFAMFDWKNQRKVVQLIREDTRQALKERLIDGGAIEYSMLL